MIELPLLEGLSTHHVFYDFPSLHLSSSLLSLRCGRNLSVPERQGLHIDTGIERASRTTYTTGVIKGAWVSRPLGWYGCREVKMEHGYLASVFDLLIFVPFFFSLFDCFDRTCHVFGFFAPNAHEGREWSSQSSFRYLAFSCFLAHI